MKIRARIKDIPIWRIKSRICDLIYPRHCVVCDGLVRPFGEKVCIECLEKITVITSPWCMKCGKKLKSEDAFCNDCMEKVHFYKSGRSLYEYRTVRKSIYRFKYEGRKEYGDFYGEQMSKYLGDFIRDVRADLLIPIPLHRIRQRMRGYNQALVLAKKMAETLPISVNSDALVRVKNTRRMKKLSVSDRQNNLKNAFIIQSNVVKSKVIVLVDDIYTTGATIDAAAKALLEAGATDVYYVTLANGTGF